MHIKARPILYQLLQTDTAHYTSGIGKKSARHSCGRRLLLCDVSFSFLSLFAQMRIPCVATVGSNSFTPRSAAEYYTTLNQMLPYLTELYTYIYVCVQRTVEGGTKPSTIHHNSCNNNSSHSRSSSRPIPTKEFSYNCRNGMDIVSSAKASFNVSPPPLHRCRCGTCLHTQTFPPPFIPLLRKNNEWHLSQNLQSKVTYIVGSEISRA